MVTNEVFICCAKSGQPACCLKIKSACYNETKAPVYGVF